VAALGRASALGAGAVIARSGALRLITVESRGASPSSAWVRTNHRGDPVSLLEGPLFVAGTAAGLLFVPGLPARQRRAALGALLAAGALGAYDDRADLDSRAPLQAKGFSGHLGALKSGRITSGTVKILGLGATGMVAGSFLRPPGSRWSERAVAGAVVAGAANLLNLLDLRPGRALKAGLLAGGHFAVRRGPAGAIVVSGLGAAAALLPADLGEHAMLGDCGANAMGALLGSAVVAQASPRLLLAALAALVALTAASERVSFTRVIESTPGLREVDQWGRRLP
jgi:UDP-N-acetylmuramyl pentapeptide phosphotransferase/UDP-N-acetylglucosamine-1-phosphate transferase